MIPNLPLDTNQYSESVLNRNPKVVRSVVENHRLLEKQLRLLGVDVDPHYTLAPALGDRIYQIDPRVGSNATYLSRPTSGKTESNS